MNENNHYFTPEQELAMELKRKEMVEVINGCDTREEQEKLLKVVKALFIEELKCYDCFNKVKNKIKWMTKQ